MSLVTLPLTGRQESRERLRQERVEIIHSLSRRRAGLTLSPYATVEGLRTLFECGDGTEPRPPCLGGTLPFPRGSDGRDRRGVPTSRFSIPDCREEVRTSTYIP